MTRENAESEILRPATHYDGSIERKEILAGFEDFRSVREQMTSRSDTTNILPSVTLIDYPSSGLSAGDRPAPPATPSDGRLAAGESAPTCAPVVLPGDYRVFPRDQRVFQLAVRYAGTSPTTEPASLTAFAVDVPRKADESVLLTAAHGLVPLHGGRSDYPYFTMKSGFEAMDADRDGQLSLAELSAAITSARNPDYLFQLKYLQQNFDAMLKETRSDDPTKTGLTDSGLRRHYMNNASAAIRTTCGDIPLKVSVADINVDVAVLTSTAPGLRGISGFRLAEGRAVPNEPFTATGYPSGFIGEVKTFGNVSGYGNLGFIPGEGATVLGPASMGPNGMRGFPHGMSGGPVTGRNDVVLGLVHGTDPAGNGYFIDAPTINLVLSRRR